MNEMAESGRKKGWTKEQARMAAHYIWTNLGATYDQIAEHIGVSVRTYHRYINDSEFIDIMQRESKRVSNYAKPRIDAALVQAAMDVKNGTQDRKLYYQLRGELKEKVENLYPEGIPDRINITVRRATKNDGPDS